MNLTWGMSPISIINFWKFLSKNFRMILWKLYIPANIGLTSMIYTSNKSKNYMPLANEISFEIYFGKIEEIKFSKNHSRTFWRNFPRFFSGEFWKIMVGIWLLWSQSFPSVLLILGPSKIVLQITKSTDCECYCM